MMILSLRRYAKYLLASPKLYRIYRREEGTGELGSIPYTPGVVEALCDVTLTYVFPVTLVMSIYKAKMYYIQVSLILYVAAKFLRSVARLTNSEYYQFLGVVDKANEAPGNTELVDALRMYDFEFSFFPVIHECRVSVSEYAARQEVIARECGVVLWWLGWGVAHSFGIRLIYPGLLLGSMLRSVLEDSRGKLVVEKRGVRVKIRAASERDSVDVDAMVFDRRGATAANSDVLVICCEGNAGFYEIGMLGGALSEGYSVLGWNHPGFGGSTGAPYPTAELTAALGVMDYAVNVLGFDESKILLYGWSIGGFPATYLASQFRNVRGLLVDASFDDLLPLAIPRMPEFMSPLVRSTVRNHVNLENKRNIEGYTGPLRLVRRTEDEIIADPPSDLKANRGNQLLVHVVLSRYPQLAAHASAVAVLNEWVKNPHDTEVAAHDSLAGKQVHIPSEVNSEQANRMIITVASSILRDFKSTHCTPLPKEFFKT